MATPNVIVLTGYGINCEEETAFAFRKAGAASEIVHINDLIGGHRRLNNYQIVAFPGGFSFGDDTGSGNAFAHKMRNTLWYELRRFVEGDHLMLGICNGFQVMVNLGLLPAINEQYGERTVALVHNTSARYNCRWVDLELHSYSPWLEGLQRMNLPVAHGEGRFYASPETLEKLNQGNHIAMRYVAGEMCRYQHLEPNPNGSLEDIAAITDGTGRLLGMMPHPERAISFTQLPHWPLAAEKLKREGREIPEEADGIKIFKNAVEYFR